MQWAEGKEEKEEEEEEEKGLIENLKRVRRFLRGAAAEELDRAPGLGQSLGRRGPCAASARRRTVNSTVTEVTTVPGCCASRKPHLRCCNSGATRVKRFVDTGVRHTRTTIVHAQSQSKVFAANVSCKAV